MTAEIAQAIRMALGTILIVSFLLALHQRNWAMTRTAAALLGCLIVNRIRFLLFGDSTPFMWYILSDAITAAIILKAPAGRIQAAIGVSFVVELCMHFAYWINLRHNGYIWSAAILYWYILFSIAIAQAALLGGWACAGLVRYRDHHFLRHRRGISEATHHSRMG